MTLGYVSCSSSIALISESMLVILKNIWFLAIFHSTSSPHHSFLPHSRHLAPIQMASNCSLAAFTSSRSLVRIPASKLRRFSLFMPMPAPVRLGAGLLFSILPRYPAIFRQNMTQLSAPCGGSGALYKCGGLSDCDSVKKKFPEKWGWKSSGGCLRLACPLYIVRTPQNSCCLKKAAPGGLHTNSRANSNKSKLFLEKL